MGLTGPIFLIHMINLNFSISNPWSDRWNAIWCKSGSLCKFKGWEFNIYKTHYLINVDLSLNVRCDHAGFQIMLGLFGYSVELHFYDSRHWNYENNCWEVYD